MQTFDVIVIGQGYAGLCAAKAAQARGLKTANFEAELFGGLIINVNELDPAPGEVHSGVELASNLAMENMEVGVENVADQVSAIERAGNQLRVQTASGDAYAARHVIVASGAAFKTLGVPGEEEFVGRGVSNCADCDGPMFQGQEAVVVGGGDSAFQEALSLAMYCSKVTLIYRGAAPRARADLIERVAADARFVQMPNTEIVAIEGSQAVEAVKIRTADGEQRLACTGVFVFVGLEPRSALVPVEVARDEAGALMTDDKCATSIPGLWVIGAARHGFGGMLTDAEADAQRVAAALR